VGGTGKGGGDESQRKAKGKETGKSGGAGGLEKEEENSTTNDTNLLSCLPE
jgi:hypothetical protein